MLYFCMSNIIRNVWQLPWLSPRPIPPRSKNPKPQLGWLYIFCLSVICNAWLYFPYMLAHVSKWVLRWKFTARPINILTFLDIFNKVCNSRLFSTGNSRHVSCVSTVVQYKLINQFVDVCVQNSSYLPTYIVQLIVIFEALGLERSKERPPVSKVRTVPFNIGTNST